MKNITLGKSGLHVSEFCLGTMMFGGQTEKKDAIEIIDYALENEVNFFDTADIYTKGNSEEILGEALKGKRDSVIIATKVGGPSGIGTNGKGLGRKHIMQSIDDSLRRLKTDYVDLFYMHFPDPDTPIEETIETMNYLISSGKIRYYGVSNFPAWKICSMVEKSKENGLTAPIATETVYNAITRGADEEILPFAKEYGIGITAYNPLAGGLLTGKHSRDHIAESSRFALEKGYKLRYCKYSNFDAVEYLTAVAKEYGISVLELAIRWIISKEEITTPIIGVSKLEQIKQNIEIVNKGALDAEIFEKCDLAWKMVSGDYFNYHR